jgi:hypothetical protein
MAGKILVALHERDRIEEIVPVLEKIARPGMAVTFLVSYPADTWVWLRDHWIVTESARKAVAEGKRVMERYSWREQKCLAERKVAAARVALETMGIEVAVMLKQGLRRAVRECVLSEEFQLILMSAGRGDTAIGLAQAGMLLLRRIKRPGSRSYSLYRLEQSAPTERPTALSYQ